jgi:glucan phosphoethanolaminetransferase (alkaline phosphatase superfamily)
MLRTINNITGAILGVALVCGAIWFRVADFTLHEMLFGYITRSTEGNSSQANDYLLIYPIIGTLIGGILVCIIIFLSSRRTKRRAQMGLSTTDPIWIMLAVVILSIAGGAFYGHNFG